MSVRVVHVFPKSPFLAFAADVFEEAAPGANTFLVLGTPAEGAQWEVPAGARRVWVTPDHAGSKVLADEIAASDIAVFHSVGAYAARLLAAAPSSVLTVWSGWGGDYYRTNTFRADGILAPRTHRFLASRSSFRNRAYHALRARWVNRSIAPAARAADVFSAPIPEDFQVFRARFRGFRGRYAQLNYASVEDSFTVAESVVAGDDILLGNSADPANNHLDVLEILRGLHTPGRRIVTPLSYGDQAYADAVVAEGARLFGSDFVGLRDFMPLAEYQDVVARCGVVVMGHRRQQAIGNVAAGLWAGAHVLMDDRSPLYAFLRKRGAGVESLHAARLLPTKRVSDEQRAANIRVLEEFWGRDTVVANARALVASLDDRARRGSLDKLG